MIIYIYTYIYSIIYIYIFRFSYIIIIIYNMYIYIYHLRPVWPPPKCWWLQDLRDLMEQYGTRSRVAVESGNLGGFTVEKTMIWWEHEEKYQVCMVYYDVSILIYQMYLSYIYICFSNENSKALRYIPSFWRNLWYLCTSVLTHSTVECLYILVNVYITMERCTIFTGKTHYIQWPCSIANC